MVIEVKNSEQVDEYIARNKIVLVAFLNSQRIAEKGYVVKLLSIIEEESIPTIRTALYVRPSNSEVNASISFNLYLNGTCVFSQEGLFGHLENDLMALKTGIKEVLKNKMIQVKFVKRS